MEEDDVDDDYDGPTPRPESVGQGIAICDGLWCVEAGGWCPELMLCSAAAAGDDDEGEVVVVYEVPIVIFRIILIIGQRDYKNWGRRRRDRAGE